MKTMKKTAIIAALMLCCLLQAFGLGRENLVDSFTITSEDGKNTVTISVYRIYGILYAKATGNNLDAGAETYEAAMVGHYSSNGDSFSWSALEKDGLEMKGLPGASAQAGLFLSIINDTGDASLKSQMKSISGSSFDLRIGVEDVSSEMPDTPAYKRVHYVRGTLSTGSFAEPYLQNLDDDGGIRGRNVFLLACLGDAVEKGVVGSALVLKRRNAAAAADEEIRLFMPWTPEYFKGEKSILLRISTPPSSYAVKVAAIMKSSWIDFPFEADFELHPDITANEKSALAAALSNDLLPLYSMEKAELPISGKVGFYPIPLGMDNPEIVKATYLSGQNPYIRAYLAKCLSISKPLYTTAIKDVEEDVYGKTYDYSKYSTADATTLGSAALTYYLWGVEYTLPKDTPEGQAYVYYKDQRLIREWVSNADGRSDDYYLPSGAVPGGIAVPLPSPGPGISATPGPSTIGGLSPFHGTGAADGPAATPAAGYYQGNPLPYVKGGIDGPRTFAYKMEQQWLTRKNKVYVPPKDPPTRSTKALPRKPEGTDPASLPKGEEKYQGGYNQEDVDSDYIPKEYKTTLGAAAPPPYSGKPFTPSSELVGKTRTEEEYDPRKFAGIDAGGFLLGAIAMTGNRNIFRDYGDVAMATELDKYYAMAGSYEGLLGADGKPGFNSYFLKGHEEELLASRKMHISRASIERVSVLVEDLEKVRIGDIVVHYGSNEEFLTLKAGRVSVPKVKDGNYFHVGIVVKVPTSLEYASLSGAARSQFIEKNIIVVHVSEGYPCVQMSGLNGFEEPGKGYSVRKLLWNTGTGGVATPEWDMLDNEVKQAALVFTNGDGTGKVLLSERWIPNTGEYLEFGVDVELKNAAGKVINGVLASESIVLKPPKDRYFDASKSAEEYGNIYNNKGDGFDLVVCSGDSYEVAPAIVVARFLNNGDGSYRFSPAFDSSGKTITPKIDEAGRLDGACQWVATFEKETMRYRISLEIGTVGTYSKFGIRPILGTIRPGDDIILSFVFGAKGNASTYIEPSLPPNTYLAVYDKKLLWRANLYVVENPLASDWNETHPWNAPKDESEALAAYPAWGKNPDGTKWEWGYNEWNVVGWNHDSGAKPGGQMTMIKPWTRWKDNGEVNGHVAYGWGCYDGVPEFNAELDAQRAQIERSRKAKGPGAPLFTGGPPSSPADADYVGADFSKIGWKNGTTAPGDTWSNYVFPKRRLAGGIHYYTQGMTEDQMKTVEQHLFSLNGSNVSVPGLSTMVKYGGTDYYGPKNGSYSDSSSRTSGTDCSGLAHRAAKYIGALYYISDKGKWNTDMFASDTLGSYQIHPGTWKLNIPDTSTPADLEQRARDRLLASLAVPGDLLVVGESHVVIVQDLEYPAGSEVITAYEQVKVIHSTSRDIDNPGMWRVQRNTWYEIGGDRAVYQLRRYR